MQSKSPKIAQIVTITAVALLVIYLFSLPIKGLNKSANQPAGRSTMVKAVNTTVDVAFASTQAKQAISTTVADSITKLEGALKAASSAKQQLPIWQQLATKWDAQSQPAPAAFYYRNIALNSNSYQAWLTAGDRFNDACRNTQDTVGQPTYVLNAVEAFQKALNLQPNSLDAKTGLGIAYVNGGAASPMQGISLLLEVIKADPKNRKANLNLGLFAMKSGQYEKAVTRFKSMIADQEELEPYFYLAESYKQLGMKTEAIEAYQNCKRLIPDPVFVKRIDAFIKELKNN
jgi:cytochrome c-type biogenesis protein CcmH/NrfG